MFLTAGRRVCPSAQTKLVSPSGRDVAQRQRGLRPSDIAFQICPDTNLPAFCPLSHLLCKCQLSQRESREGGAGCTPDASSELLRRLVRVLLLPSRLAPCHLPQGGRLWVSAQSKLVSPSGRDVAQRQRGLIPADMAFQICPDTNWLAFCPLSHLLRKCQLSQRESREAGAS